MIVAKCINVTKVYKKKIYALKDISLEVREGEFLAIVGPSGAGKSTLLNILGTFDKPTSGSVIINNIDVSKLNSAFGNKTLSELRKKFLGFIFQTFNLLPELTVENNLSIAMKIKLGYKDEKEIDKLLEKVGLLERKDHLPSQLSAGEQQRVAIARALIGNPKLILADEPTANLDKENAKNVFKILKDLTKEKNAAVVVASHNPMVFDFAERYLILDKGRLVI